MNILKSINSMLNAGSTNLTSLITKAVVQTKVKSFISNLKQNDFEQRSQMEKMVEQVEDSTGTIGEVIDSLFATFGDGYKGVHNTITLAICENEDAITNLIANNATSFVALGKAYKNLNTDINKQSVMSIVSNIKEEVDMYLEEEFKPKVNDDITRDVEPKLKETGKIWGMKMTYTTLSVVKGIVKPKRVSKDQYDAHKASYLKANGKWDESVSLFSTKQISCIHPDLM